MAWRMASIGIRPTGKKEGTYGEAVALALHCCDRADQDVLLRMMHELKFQHKVMWQKLTEQGRVSQACPIAYPQDANEFNDLYLYWHYGISCRSMGEVPVR